MRIYSLMVSARLVGHHSVRPLAQARVAALVTVSPRLVGHHSVWPLAQARVAALTMD